MRSLLCFAAAMALLGVVPAARAGETKSAPDRDVQDFVYSGGKKPIVIRAHVFIDGKPLHEVWDAFFVELFAYLDVDGDGVLSKEESARAPSPQALMNPLAFFQRRNPDTPLLVDKLTKAELSKWYRHYGATPIQFLTGPPRGQSQFIVYSTGQGRPLSADALTEKLFSLLDTDKDGKLDRQELARAPEVLCKLDADDDETVSIEEMSGIPWTNMGGAAFAFASTAQAPTVKSGLFALLDSEEGRKRTPDLELRIRMGKRAAKEAAIELIGPKDHSALARSIGTGREGGLLLDFGSTQIELRPDVNSGVRTFAGVPKQQYLTLFRRLDRDNNGYLDQKEAAQFPLFSTSFRVMDRDGDGKLDQKEVIAYLEKMAELRDLAARSCVSLSIQDQGRGLFDWIDADKDGRLSVRELRHVAERIARFDHEGKGRIGREDIPRRYRLTVRQGPAINNAVVPRSPVVALGRARMPSQPKPASGPKWFQKMDRNRDGDVSRREFLGSDEEFRRIDADGDGLISREEAEQADKKWRDKSEPRP